MVKHPDGNVTLRRRQVIKELVLKRGVTNRAELKRILDLEYPDLSTSRQTIYKDFKLVSQISDDDYHNFGSVVIGNYVKMINDQMDDIDGEKDASKRSTMRRTLSQLMKDHTTVTNMLHGGSVRESEAEKTRRVAKEVKSISFG